VSAGRPSPGARFAATLAAAALLGCAGAPASPAAPPGPEGEVVDLSAHFAGLAGAFVLYDDAAGAYLRHDPRRCARRFSPCSTFKIANALIALDAGVASGPDFAIPWEPRRDPEQPFWKELGLDWARDHTLASAMRESAVWYFQEIARRIGPERMAAYLARFGYGNRDLSGGLDRFWLESTLAISADEQVGFLRRLHGRELGVSEAATAALEEIIVRERGDGWVLRGKTGSGGGDGRPGLGWLVGWVEARGNDTYFALNVSGDDLAQVRAVRLAAAKSILRARGVLPPDAP